MRPAQLEKLVERTRIFLRDRKTAYQLTFSSPAGRVVYQDLVKFCHGTTTTFRRGVSIERLEGRREVLLRIGQHMNLTTDQLFALYNGTAPTPVPTSKEDDNDD